MSAPHDQNIFGRPQGIMLQILLIMLFRISLKTLHYAYNYSFMLLIVIIILKFLYQ